MKSILVISFFLLLFSAKQQVSSADIDQLTGGRWIGKLTYLDYTSHEKTTILADLIVSKVPNKPNAWTFRNEYPKEPKANGESIVLLTQDGTDLDGETVQSREIVAGSLIKIITAKKVEGKSYRYTYTIGKTTLSIRKEEKGLEDKDYFERNVYEFTRVK
jgi:hypothetical protein